jgi:hypothetical protein
VRTGLTDTNASRPLFKFFFLFYQNLPLKQTTTLYIKAVVINMPITPFEFRATVPDTEPLETDIELVEIASARGAQTMILAEGTKQKLVDRAVREVRRKFDENKRRGLY